MTQQELPFPQIKKIPTRIVIERVLAQRMGEYLAVHEIGVLARQAGFYFSDNAAATRLSEMKTIVTGRFRQNCNFKEWGLRRE